MSDNTTLNAGTGGDVIATDDIGGVKYQRVKVTFGADGAATDASSSDPLPVTLAAGTNNIGDVDVLTLPSLPAGTNAIGKLSANSGVDIGDVDVTSVPADPFGANADAGSATGSISAKLRFIASTGIPVTSLPALAAGTNNIGDVDVLTLPALPAGTNAIGKLAANSGVDIGDVDVTSVPAPLNVTGNGAASTALRVTLANDSTGIIAGDVAHDVGDSGNPVKIGAKAVAFGANPTGVTANDRTQLYANRAGILFTLGGHPNIITTSVRIADATGAQTDASIVGTINTGTKVAVTAVSIMCSKANTANIAVKLGFGASTIPADSTSGAAGVLFDHEGIAPGSGVVIGNGSGILGVGADGEELRLTCDDPVGGFVTVTFSYFTIES